MRSWCCSYEVVELWRSDHVLLKTFAHDDIQKDCWFAWGWGSVVSLARKAKVLIFGCLESLTPRQYSSICQYSSNKFSATKCFATPYIVRPSTKIWSPQLFFLVEKGWSETIMFYFQPPTSYLALPVGLSIAMYPQMIRRPLLSWLELLISLYLIC